MVARDARPLDRSPWRQRRASPALHRGLCDRQASSKAKRLADRPQLLGEMKQPSRRSRGNCQAPRSDIPRLSEGRLSTDCVEKRLD